MDVISPEVIELVKQTVPVLRKHGFPIVSTFYDTLFERYPEVKKQFNTDRQKGGKSTENGVPAQVSALATAVMAYAKNIDKIDAILPAVECICHKHICRGVAAVQYDAVGECLLAAMKIHLGDAISDETMEAWRVAYANLAQVFIKVEKRLREELEESAGYTGFTKMVVVDIGDSTEGGKKLSIEPRDVRTPPYTDGQFVGICIAEEEERVTMTTMELVDMEKGEMWISVPKSEEKATMYLLNEVKIGSVLDVSVPAGKRVHLQDETRGLVSDE